MAQYSIPELCQCTILMRDPANKILFSNKYISHINDVNIIDPIIYLYE